MNIFSPYHVIEHTEKRLHLALPKWRRRLQLFFFRVFPFLLLALTSPIVFYAEDMPMGLLYLVVLSVIIIAFMLFFKKYAVEVDITDQSILLVQKSVGGLLQQQVMINDIEELTCKIRHGKYGGTFFKVRLKTGEKLEIITIPAIIMKRENTDQVIDVVEQITGLKTTMDLPFYSRK